MNATHAFIMRNGRLILDRGGGSFVNLPVDEDAEYICPYCGSMRTEHRGIRIHCANCGNEIGWSARLKRPCADCGKVSKKWTARADGKVEVTCRCCGDFEAYPD